MKNHQDVGYDDFVKTLSEHCKIIVKYDKTGKLDKADAAEKFCDFNAKHPAFHLVNISMSGGNLVNAYQAQDAILVNNLRNQVRWLYVEYPFFRAKLAINPELTHEIIETCGNMENENSEDYV